MHPLCSQPTNTLHGVPHAEGAHAKRRRGRPSKADRAARRGRSMGRYPLKNAAKVYLERRANQVSESTMANERRIVNHIVGAIEGMRERGEISTSSPTEIGPAEVRAFLDWMCAPELHGGKALDPDTQVRYLSKIEAILKMNGNRIIERMREEGTTFPQRIGRKPIRAIAEEDLGEVQAAALNVKSCRGEPEGWRRAKARFLSVIYVATGLRPSELRLAKMEDLDVRKWRIYVRNPKGGGKYAVNRTVTIMPPYRQEVLEYLREREELIRYYGRSGATYLIPNLREGSVKGKKGSGPKNVIDTHYSSNHFRELKKEMQDLSGINFRLKDFRPTFATLSVEKDPNLLVDVSAQLGHSNLTTTQRYYAQISAESAGSRLEKAWEKKHISERSDKNTNSEDVLLMLLQALGVNSSEDLQMLLSNRSPGLLKPRIEGSGQTYIR